MDEHGFWIPLTILFVLRPERTRPSAAWSCARSAPRSAWCSRRRSPSGCSGDGVALAVALTIATAFAYGLLTVQYALFTAAITTYAVLLADSIGEPALHAAGQRALATAIGIAIAGAAFLLWPNRGEGRLDRSTASRRA